MAGEKRRGTLSLAARHSAHWHSARWRGVGRIMAGATKKKLKPKPHQPKPQGPTGGVQHAKGQEQHRARLLSVAVHGLLLGDLTLISRGYCVSDLFEGGGRVYEQERGRDIWHPAGTHRHSCCVCTESLNSIFVPHEAV